MNKKYLPSALILYLNYFIHGVGCSILGQAVIKEALAASWGVEAMAITAISAALGLGRLIALPFAGPLSDKLGRRISTAIGSASYAVYLIGLALAFNAGTNGGYMIAYVCAIVGGIANSFLDTGIYPAVSEIIYKAPGVATMGIKFFISVSQMLLPFVLGVTVATTATGATSYNTLFYACGIAYLVLLVLVMIFPLPDTDQKAAGKKEGLIDSLKHTHFSVESIAMILIGFTCTGTFQLWLNCAQNFAKENVGWADPSIMQTYYSAGTMLALILTALLTIIVGQNYPFQPIQLSVINGCAVAIPTMLLQLEPSFQKVNKHFFREVLRMSMPAAITITAMITIINNIGHSIGTPREMLSTVCVLATGWVYLITLRQVYSPMTGYRKFVIYLMQTAYLVAMVIGQRIMELVGLNFTCVIVTLAAVNFAPMIIDLATKGYDKFFYWYDHRHDVKPPKPIKVKTRRFRGV